MKALVNILLIFGFVLTWSCADSDSAPATQPTQSGSTTFKYLALGDSYTIGQSVCETCCFPAQLTDSLGTYIGTNDISIQLIAQTGWTTSNLIAAIEDAAPPADFDLVTLLIGVNNQYQNKPFSLYEAEFPQLVTTAILLAKGDKNNVIVVSIPDYAFTPFGQSSSNPSEISVEIDQYNAFAKSYCEQNDIGFVDITDITREGLNNSALVASDGLHPSEVAYTEFTRRILPIASAKLLD
ncbi:MAG TPA: SGNH/GDSL hydrolase family protein [Flavobacterium sp.]